MKKALGLAAAGLLTLSLTACSDGGGSSDSGGDYCTTLKDSQTDFAQLDPTALDEQKFNDLSDRVSELEDQAPSSVADDWGTVGDQLDKFKSLLDEAGIGLDDLQSLQQNKVPEGVDPAKLQAMIPKMQEFASDPSLEEAQQAIKDNAKTECDITLGG